MTLRIKIFLTLTEKDKMRLLANRPLSLHEFREKIHQLLITKSVRNNIEDVTEFDPAYNISDSDIARRYDLEKKHCKTLKAWLFYGISLEIKIKLLHYLELTDLQSIDAVRNII